MRRACLAATLLTCLLPCLDAADDTAEPARWIGEHPLVTVRALDVPRSFERLAHSPYAGCLDTPWGALLASRLRGALGVESRVDGAALAASIRGVAVGIGLRDAGSDPDIRWAVSTGDDVEPMRQLCRELEPERGDAGRIVEAGRVFAFGQARVGPAAAASAARFPDACVELTLDPGQLAGALGIAPPTSPSDSRRVAIGLRVDDIGLRERWDLPIVRAHRRAWAALRLPRAKPELLAALPADALLGCTFTADGTSGLAALASSGLADDPLALVAFDLALARAGMPPLSDLLAGLNGDTVMWLEAGSPVPTVTIVAGMREELARRILPILALCAGLSPGEPGPDGEATLIGFLGASPIEAGYRDGRLVLTTHPDGVAGALTRQAGFASHADGAAALAEIPADAVFAGVSRSGPAAGALSRLALAPLAHLGLPQLATIPRDLERRGQHGFIALRQVDDGLRLDAGGLLGGPCAAYAALGGAAWATCSVATRRLQRELDRLREAPGPTGTAVGGKSM